MDDISGGGWTLAGTGFDDDELPEPFDDLGVKSNNIGAAIWIHLATGAMVAAVPTAVWKAVGQFAFHYCAPGSQRTIPLRGWTAKQDEWSGADAVYGEHKRVAVSFGNALLGLGDEVR